MGRIRRLLPFVISIILLTALATYAPWTMVWHILSGLDATVILLLVLLSLTYYALKTWRFWWILRAIGLEQSFSRVAASYMSAQPLTLLPAGEIFRSHSLRRYTGIPVKISSPQFVLQGLFEGSAMAVLMIISALALGTLRIAALIFLAIVVMSLLGIRRDYLATGGRLLNKVPFLHLNERSIIQFSNRNKKVMTKEWLPRLLIISLVIEITGSAIAFVAVKGVHGDIEFYEAVIVYTVPIIAGFISLLPGGLGVSEQSAIGIILLSRNNIGVAVAGTLLMRVTIVLLGVLYGGVVSLGSKLWLSPAKHHPA